MSYYPLSDSNFVPPNPQGQFQGSGQIVYSNRLIYVKQDFFNNNPVNLIRKPKVLVNPHFKKKVYVNPNFNPQAVPQPLPKPKIHINPNVLKNFASKKPEVQEIKPTTVITTRTKIVRIPNTNVNNMAKSCIQKRRNSLHSKYKIVRSNGGTSPSKFNTKYKIVRSNNPIQSRSKYKLDKRVHRTVNNNLKTIKKKYVYVNRFLSISVMAKSILLKQNTKLTKPGFVNINGMLYKKSPNSLKKASDTTIKPSRNILPSKYKVDNKAIKHVGGRSAKDALLLKRFKIIRSRKQVIAMSGDKLKKCNIPCQVYRKFGRCRRKENGTCFKLHNPDQIVLCTKFLQGACHDDECPLSHKVSLEKMPTCKFFLEGLCSKDDCPYLHVKISPKAEICKDFLEGFCKSGAQCNKRHQLLCPDFEKNKKCIKKRCPYPHGNLVRNRNKNVGSVAKKCSVKKERILKKKVIKAIENETNEHETNNRYYKENNLENSGKNSSTKNEEKVMKTISKDRPKLGDLPAFIPLSQSS